MREKATHGQATVRLDMIMRDGEDCAGRVQAVAEDFKVLPVVSAVEQSISTIRKRQ
jgi:hypothetical protein